MIYVTADTHGDMKRWKDPALRKLKKGDTLIVCGDFGFIWDGSKKEKRNLEWIGKRKYTVVFVEGCHENYELLQEYPQTEWNGGQVRRISGKLRLLLRGEVYDIDGERVLAFGGGVSPDADERMHQGHWWESEAVTEADAERADKNLSKTEDTVDFVVSHEPPLFIKNFLAVDEGEDGFVHYCLDKIARRCHFRRWYFGKYHMEKLVPPVYEAVYQNIVKAE